MMAMSMSRKITRKGQTILANGICDELGVHSGVRKAGPFDLPWHRAISPTLAERDSTNDRRTSMICDAIEVVVA
jgi:hypothetical protein